MAGESGGVGAGFGAGVAIALALWALGCVWACRHLGVFFTDRAWRLAAQLLALGILLPLPLADELLARPQWQAVCDERAQLVVHSPRALTPARSGLRHQALPPEVIETAGVRIEIHPGWLVDPALGLVVASYHWVEARGGWLARWVQGEGTRPVSFAGHCAPPELQIPNGPGGAWERRSLRGTRSYSGEVR